LGGNARGDVIWPGQDFGATELVLPARRAISREAAGVRGWRAKLHPHTEPAIDPAVAVAGDVDVAELVSGNIAGRGPSAVVGDGLLPLQAGRSVEAEHEHIEAHARIGKRMATDDRAPAVLTGDDVATIGRGRDGARPVGTSAGIHAGHARTGRE